MRETNKYLRRKSKPTIQRSEKTHRPKIRKKIKYPKQSIQRLLEGHEEIDIR